MNDGPRVYIAGAMNSVGGNFNFPLFDYVAEKLRMTGCTVFSPADHARKHLGTLEDMKRLTKEEMELRRIDLMEAELVWILRQADFVIMLPGWERSEGAKAERQVAIAARKPVREAPGHILMLDEQEIHDLGLTALDHARNMA